MPRCAIPLAALFDTLKGQCSGISIVDSTPIAVCDNLRIPRHKVFAGLAARGKSSTGWFFGFKLHVVINHRGEILAIRLTPGNVDDRKPVAGLCQSLFGKLFGDKKYLARWLSDMLAKQHVHLITKVRKNMKPIELTPFDQALLRQRSLIETVFDELKNLCQIGTYATPFLFELCRQPHGRCSGLLSCAQQATLAGGDNSANSLIPALIPN